MEKYIIDIILSVIFLVIVFVYYKKGLVKSILDFVAFFASFVISAVFSGRIVDWVLSNTKLFSNTEKYIAKLVITILCFIVVSLVLELIISFVDKVFKLPVLKQANKFLGVLLGIGCGAIAVVIICIGLRVSAQVVYNQKYTYAVNSSVIVKTVLSEEKLIDNIKELK